VRVSVDGGDFVFPVSTPLYPARCVCTTSSMFTLNVMFGRGVRHVSLLK
jgi:hypothetical protein